jgi:hypothetical protein
VTLAVGVQLAGIPARLSAQAADDTQPLAEALSLDPGATCLEHDRLTARVVRWREQAGVAEAIRVQVRGDARLATRVYFSVLRVGTQPTERVLDNAPSDCDQLHSAVALSIALAIDALLAGEHAARGPPAALLVPQPSAARGGRARAGPSGSLEFGLQAGATVGVVPATAAAAFPRLQYSPFPWLAFVLNGLATRASGLAIAGTPGNFDATVLALGVDACFGGEAAERVSFFSCAGMRGGVFVTEGRYIRDRALGRRWWAVAGSGQARAWILPSFALGISIEALYALAARDLVVESATPGSPAQRMSLSRFGLSIAAGPIFKFF